MSRITKWKLEKTKVKVVFRLQFHATHIPQSGWDKLFISFIPAESGKTTITKTSKANVRNGTCKWADPIYETTRLLQDSKTKQYDEKLYKIVVAMGSSRASTLGEATINLADYVDALKPSAVALLLHGCNFGTILHITVQLLTSKTGFREFEQQRELSERGSQSGADRHGHGVAGKLSFAEEVTNDQVDKVSGSVKSKTDVNEFSSLDEDANLNEEYSDSAGFDVSSSTSETLYAEKHETSSTHEIDSLKSTDKGDPSDRQTMAHTSSDNELTMAYEENARLRGNLELVESSFCDLKLEVSSLEILADELGTETKKISHLLASEISSAEQLAKEVSVLKSEALELKDEIIRHKDLKFNTTKTRENRVVQKMKLGFLKGISIAEDRIRELQNKTCVLPDVYSELEALLNILQDVKCENVNVNLNINAVKDEEFVPGNGFGLDLCPPDSILQHFIIPTPASDLVNPIDAMKGQILDLVRELDESKIEKEALTRKMDQMECYYEALISGLEENQKRLLGELQLLGNEHSTCLYTLSASRAEMESMSQEMLRLAEERNDVLALNKEFERRATSSEAALRRARLNYSIAVDKLQKDLEVLSSQVVSMFETNENLIKQAFVESSPPPLEEDGVTKLPLYQTRKRSSVGSDVLLDDLRKSVSLQEELYRKVEEELIEMYSLNLNLDIYSWALQESLFGVNAEFGIMKEMIDQLVRELQFTSASEKQLMERLQKATDDIHMLNEFKASCISQCSDLSLQNQLLEDKLESVSKENDVLAQKLKDLEIIMTEYKSYKQKFETCLAENAELSLSLKQESFEKEKLQDEMLVLKEKLTILKTESDGLVSLKENLFFVESKLASLLESCDQQFCDVDNIPTPDLKSIDVRDAILQLEKIQHNSCERIFQLMEENRTLENERVVADASLSSARSEILDMKQKFKFEIQDMVAKLDISNALVGKLQVEIDSVANKFYFSSEVEERYACKIEELLADLVLLENQMQELSCENGKEISSLDALAEELLESKSTIAELMHEKQELAVSVENKTVESVKLSSEIGNLKENLRNLQEELDKEKGHGNVLEEQVRDLTSQLNMDNDKLIVLERQRSELMHSKELASDLELEKSRISHLLGQQNVLIEKLRKDISCQESQLLEMHEYLLVQDVKTVYFANQYDTLLRELQERYNDLKAKYNASEAFWGEEKSNLLTTLRTVKSDLEVSEAQNKLLSDSNGFLRDELEECKEKLMTIEKTLSSDKNLQASELEQLKNMVTDANEEIDCLLAMKEELEILVLVLKGKVTENFAEDELLMLRSKYDDLSQKLSEQVLKTEEFKNLSTHLKELNDKAEAEKKETVAVQESLRIAFIKEQCETKVQELKQQLSMSKKHGEEMLLKLQDAIDEIENRKKSEAVNLKRNKELSLRLSQLEAEFQSTVTEKREKIKAYDRTKAEFECALLSLECCKEEKEKCEAALRELEAEKSRLAMELSMVKEQMENLTSSKISKDSELNGSNGNSTPVLVSGENAESLGAMQLQVVQDSASRGIVPQNNGDYLDFDGVAQKLRSSMEHLHEELEKMKNENTAFEENHEVDTDFQVPQSEIMKLHTANEELKRMFPLFDEITSGGNPLQRVLALEIELAEALKTKNKPNMQFQSSFLKQHSDEEAVFRSFRDINELIKELLDLKGRHAAMETELREMHGRYSELSLQFAEVEGERQKLQMTLKNVRSSRKHINRSFSADVVDHPS